MDIDPRDLIQPGPEDPSVLYLQDGHRSCAIWDRQEVDTLRLRRSDGELRRDRQPVVLPVSVQAELVRVGFYGAYRVGYMQLDHAFITALVERWRPETHTFHLPVGECTITLQDVAILLGLPIDGTAVIAEPISPAEIPTYQQLCLDILGIQPNASQFSGSRLKLTWLSTNFAALPDGADEVTIQRYARAWILQLLGGSLLSDKSSSMVRISFLPLLRDLDVAAKCSWGSAALAVLYREMCRASNINSKEIGGPLILLQLWGWTRLLHVRPERVIAPPTLDGDVAREIDRQPYGSRWRESFSLKYTPIRVLSYYRDQLDRMRDEQMIWQPYTDEVIATLPTYCLKGKDIWHTISPLICFNIVEWHLPDRVIRQFGLSQAIPTAFDTSPTLHKTDGRGRSDYNWAVVHAQFIHQWDHRHQHIAQAAPLAAPLQYNDPYMVWYRRITRRFVGPPPLGPSEIGAQPVGSILEILGDSLAKIHGLAEHLLGGPHAPHYAVTGILNLSETALRSIREEQRLRADPLEVRPLASVPIPQTRTRTRRAASDVVRDPRPEKVRKKPECGA